MINMDVFMLVELPFSLWDSGTAVEEHITGLYSVAVLLMRFQKASDNNKNTI